jgi:3-oxoacyl-[acyl-carrier protein] reductase
VRNPVDVSNPDDVRGLVARTLALYGRIDIMVANAAVSHDHRIQDLPIDQFNEMLATNLAGVFHCIQAVAPTMKEQGSGRIITLSSSLATRPAIGTAVYSATKAAVEALTRGSAIDLGRHGILVNCLAPGVLDEGGARRLLDNDKVWAAYRKRFALGRPGTGTEAARAAVFLASAESSYINGHVLEVNGGLSWA